MTGPVTTEARALIRHSLKVGAPGLSETAREAVLRSIMLKIEGKVLAPFLASLQQVTAERDEAREFGSCAYDPDLGCPVYERADTAEASLATANAELARLRAEGEALKEDAARLDFLDGCNARLNASYGTHYGWKLVLNHNVNRLVLGDMKVDLHDSEGGNDKLPSCRLAIDEARARTALARAATAREG